MGATRTPMPCCTPDAPPPAAAELLGEGRDAARYRARRIELEQAIERTYRTPEGAWTDDFGASGGWALWPIRVKPYDDPRSRAQAEVNWERVRPTFDAPRGRSSEATARSGSCTGSRTSTPRSIPRAWSA
jgi:hypothetical protein